MFRRLGELTLFRGTRGASRLFWAATLLALCGYLLTAFVVYSARNDISAAQTQRAAGLLDRVVLEVQERLTFFDDLLRENADHLDGSTPRAMALGRLCTEYARQATLRGVGYLGFVPELAISGSETVDTTLCSFEGQRIRQERIDWRALMSPADISTPHEMTLLWGVKNRQMAERLGITEAVVMMYPVTAGPDNPKVIGRIILLAKAGVFGEKLLENDEEKLVRVQAWPEGVAVPVPAVTSKNKAAPESGDSANLAGGGVASVTHDRSIFHQNWHFEATYLKGFWDEQLQKSLSIITWGGMILSTALGFILLLVGASLQSLEQFLQSLRARLSNSEQFSHDVVANLAEGVYTTDLSGRITFINPEACRLLGYQQNEILFQNDHNLFHRLDEPDGCRMIASIRRGDAFESDDEEFCSKDGRIFPVAVIASPMVRAFKTVGMVVSFRDITKEQSAQHEIWWQANFDTLTHLPNRSLFFDRLRQDISRTVRNNEILGLLFIDLDGFKSVNDTQGHEIGDQLLVAVAERITSCVRESDTVARLGGDEFTVTLVRQLDPLDIERIAEKIRTKLSEPIQIREFLLRVSASIGVAICPVDTTHFDELLSLADNAMYESKRLGKNCIRFSSVHIREEAIERQVVLNDLRKAIDATQLTFQLQPILNLDDGKISKAEMLVRWDHPERGHISPSHFVDIAERTGAIVQLGDLVFQMGLDWLAEHQARLPSNFQLSINVSPIQFQVNPGKAEEWVRQMKEIGVSPSTVFIEITENALLVNDQNVRANLEHLKAHGVSLALDDFGSGYSSMANLRNFAIDFIKIDQQFVQRMLQDKNERSITEGIVSLAHRLGICVIAEGVESMEQAVHLNAMGCEYIQGYWVATPMWPQEFAVFMETIPRAWPWTPKGA